MSNWTRGEDDDDVRELRKPHASTCVLCRFDIPHEAACTALEAQSIGYHFVPLPVVPWSTLFVLDRAQLFARAEHVLDLITEPQESKR